MAVAALEMVEEQSQTDLSLAVFLHSFVGSSLWLIKQQSKRYNRKGYTVKHLSETLDYTNARAFLPIRYNVPGIYEEHP